MEMTLTEKEEYELRIKNMQSKIDYLREQREKLTTYAKKYEPLTVDKLREQMEVLQFLDGSSSLDGVWFGEEHPKALQGKYWWRKRLHRAFDIAFHGIKEKYNEKNEM